MHWKMLFKWISSRFKNRMAVELRHTIDLMFNVSV